MSNDPVLLKYEESVSNFIKNHSMATDAKSGDVFYTIPFAFKKVSENVFEPIPIPDYQETILMKSLILKLIDRVENNDPYYLGFFANLSDTEQNILQTIK